MVMLPDNCVECGREIEKYEDAFWIKEKVGGEDTWVTMSGGGKKFIKDFGSITQKYPLCKVCFRKENSQWDDIPDEEVQGYLAFG